MSVYSSTQINLIWCVIFLESPGQVDDGILFSFLDMVEESVAPVILISLGKLCHLFNFILLSFIFNCWRISCTQGYFVPTKAHFVSNRWKPPSFGLLILYLRLHSKGPQSHRSCARKASRWCLQWLALLRFLSLYFGYLIKVLILSHEKLFTVKGILVFIDAGLWLGFVGVKSIKFCLWLHFHSCMAVLLEFLGIRVDAIWGRLHLSWHDVLKSSLSMVINWFLFLIEHLGDSLI